MAAKRLLDIGLANLYARAVLAVARANDEIVLEQGQRLVAQLEARSGQPISLADLLLAEPLEPGELAAQLRAPTSPFRATEVHPSELAAMIVTDGIGVVLAKGYVSEEEARELVKFALALGCSVDDVRAMSPHLTPFLAALDDAITFESSGAAASRAPGATARTPSARARRAR